MSVGMVYLVGAGPGASDLVTVRGKELIERCDALVYDYLVYDELLTWTKRSCEKTYVGKRSGYHSKPQEDIEKLLIKLAKDGKMVVRLKGGDPFVFGRGGEEADALLDAGITFEIVPGVTASVGTAASMGIPLTHRNDSSAVVLVTGHEDPEKSETAVNWDHYAKLDATLCIYMGLTKLDYISSELLKAGMDPETSVAIVRWATLPTQESCIGKLGTISKTVIESGIKPPAMIIIGEVVRDAPKHSWFEQKPLFGKRIAITRTRQQSSELMHRLHQLGADVLELPLIKVSAAVDEQVKKDVFFELGSYDWIVFSSPNGVRYFFKEFFSEYKDVRSMGFMRIAAVGPATVKEIEQFHLEVEIMPEKHTGADLAEALIGTDSIEHSKVLVVKGNLGSDDLIKPLEEKWAIVDRFEVYKTEASDLSENAAAEKFRQLGAHGITFTSGSTVRSFVKQAKALQLEEGAETPKTFSIGPVTSKLMKEMHVPLVREAKESTLDGLIVAIVEELVHP
ncbi:MAG: uroporphyrinogen-III C-methyltransferase [Verrucomicrobia bacterium]|nr:uroporphyrinogen-III C-methyltransferase [Verrucomicrobiota bacterium]